MRGSVIVALALALVACGASDRQACTGTLVTMPANGSGDAISQLMAQAAAMGMSTQDAQTLIYLEGLSPQVTLKPGETICLDGRPDQS